MRLRRSTASPPRYHDPDWWLFAILLTLVMFGTVMIFSASVPNTAGVVGLGQYSVLIRQLIYVMLGSAGLLLAMRIDYHRLAAYAFPAMVGALLLLAALVFVPGVGTTVYGAKAWIIVGPFSMQPSELAKLVMIVYMATWFAGKGAKVRSFSSGLAQFTVLIGLLVALLMLEPDLGTATLVVTVGVAMFFVAGAHPVHFAGFVISCGAGFLAMALSASYRRDRLLLFLNPDEDLQRLGWQLYQARLALGTGGLFGVGLGASRQKFSWLPAAHNDAIFAVIGEELGLVGCVFVIGMFIAVGYRGYRIAMKAPDAFGTLMAVGVTTWLIFQAAYNIGGVTLAIPFTGIPLPFISAGGSSLIVAMTAVGILLNISRQTLSEAELRPRTSFVAVQREAIPDYPRQSRPSHGYRRAMSGSRHQVRSPEETSYEHGDDEQPQHTAPWRIEPDPWTRW